MATLSRFFFSQASMSLFKQKVGIDQTQPTQLYTTVSDPQVWHLSGEWRNPGELATTRSWCYWYLA